MPKFKVGDEVVRVRGIQDVTLRRIPIGSVMRITSVQNVRRAEWGVSYSAFPDSGFVVSDCDFEFNITTLENE